MFGLSQYKVLFMTEILVAELLFFFRLEKKKNFCLRLISGIVVCYLAAIFYPLKKDGGYDGFLTSLMFASLFALSFLAFKFSFKISWSRAFFCCIVAYTTQHLAYQIFSFIFSVFALPVSNILYGNSPMDFSNMGRTEFLVILGYLGVYSMTYGIIFKFIKKRITNSGELKLENSKVLLLLVLILLIDVVLNALVIGLRNGHNDLHEYDVYLYGYDIVIYVYSILSCVLLIYMQYSIMHVKSIEKEVESISQILYQAQKQYDSNKENVNLINIKCHDLKHQVSNYEGRGLDKDTIEEIKDLISVYDSKINTGNEVLDVILTEKSLSCKAKGISLTCMADCKSLNYVKEGDLYALFGNILDNAMEAVSEIEEVDKRCISINAREVKNCVSILVKNYYCKKLKFSDGGVPLTTKNNADYHGFGLPSVKAIVEKYDGTVTIEADGEVFSLSVLFPVKKSGQNNPS